ncbi:hypothetical protein Daqu01_03340 [Deinococcus aquaticus]
MAADDLLVSAFEPLREACFAMMTEDRAGLTG